MATRKYKSPPPRKLAPKRPSRSSRTTRRHRATWLRPFLWSLFVLAVLFVGACHLYVSWVAMPYCYSRLEQMPATDYALVLGTGAASDQSAYYRARLDAAIELGRAHKVGAVIVSGENCRSSFAEVDAMAATLRDSLPDLSILIDSTGVDTYTSLATVGERYGYDRRYTIVSQRFHAERAVVYARQLWLSDPVAYCAPDHATWLWRLRNALREPLARVKAMLFRP